MKTVLDMTVVDLNGAAIQWQRYIAETLRFEFTATAQIGLVIGKTPSVILEGRDTFQKKAEYRDRVGELWEMISFTVDEAWDDVCARVWEKLQSQMQRDEREVRSAMKSMGSFLENAPTFETEVGKMLAQRIKTARDDAAKYLEKAA